MSINIATIRGRIELEDEFSAALSAASGKLQSFGTSIQKTARGIATVGVGLTAAITAPIVALGNTSVKAASDFESSFAGVRKTVDGTEKELSDLSDTIRSMSANVLPVAVDKLNAIGESAGQLGIKIPSMEEFIDTIAKIGVTTDLSNQKAAEGFAQLGTVTDLQQDKFDNLGSALVALGNNMATTESKILNMAVRMGSTATQAGFTASEILALSAAVASTGIRVQAGGTAIQQTLITIIQAIATGNDNLKIFADTAGLTIGEFRRLFEEDGAEAFESFVKGLGSQGQQAFDTLDKLGLAGSGVTRTLTGLAGAGDLLEEAFDRSATAFRENTALSREAEIRFGTFASQMQQAKNQAHDIAITLGNALIPVLLDVMEMLSPLSSVVKTLADRFSDLPDSAKKVIIVIAGIAATIGPLLVAVGAMLAAWGALSAAIPVLGGAIAGVVGFITGPVGIIVALSALMLTFRPVREFIMDLATRAFSFLVSATEALVSSFRTLWRATKSGRVFLSLLANFILGTVIAGMNLYISAVVAAAEAIMSVVSGVVEWVRGLADWQRVFDIAVEMVAIFTDEMIELISKIVKGAIAFVEWSGIIGLVKNNLIALGNVVVSVGAGISALISKLLSLVGGLKGIKSIISLVNPVLGVAISKLEDFAAQAAENIDRNELLEVSVGGVADSVETLTKKTALLIPKIVDTEVAVKAVKVTTDSYLSSSASLIDTTKDVTKVMGDNEDSLLSVESAYTAVNDILEDAIPTAKGFKDSVDDLTGKLNKGVISQKQYNDALEDLEDGLIDSRKESDRFATSMGDVARDVTASADVITDAFSGVFGRDAMDLMGLFTRNFDSVFKNLTRIGKGSARETARSWRDSARDIMATANAVAAAMAAASGDSQAMWTAAFEAIEAFASGNWLQAIIAVIGIIIGLLSRAFASKSTLHKAVEKWGLDLSTELFNTLKGLTKQLGDAGAAIRISLADIIDEVGIADAEELRKFIELATLLFEDLEEGVINAGQAMTSLQETVPLLLEAFNSAGGGAQEFRNIVNLLVVSLEKVTTGEVNAADAAKLINDNWEELILLMQDLGPAGVNAIEKIVQAARAAGLEIESITEQLQTTWSEMLDILEQRNEFLIKQSKGLLEGLLGFINESTILVEKDIVFSAQSVMQAFDAMIEAGLPLGDILEAIGNKFDIIARKGNEMGINLGQDFSDFGDVMDILANKRIRDVIDRLGNMGQVAENAGNIGKLTFEQFQAFGGKLNATFLLLEEQGLSSEQALKLLHPQLQLLRDLAQQYNFDLETQQLALLDTADSMGLVADKGLTMEDILITGFDNMVLAINRLIEAMGGIPIKIGEWGDAADRNRDIFNGMTDDMLDRLNELEDKFGPGFGGFGPAGGAAPVVFKDAPPGFQSGTGVFKDFGVRSAATLHGVEQVLTAREGSDIASMVATAIRTAQAPPERLPSSAMLDMGTDRVVEEQVKTRRSIDELTAALLNLQARTRTEKVKR